jgi:hypothetical protein
MAAIFLRVLTVWRLFRQLDVHQASVKTLLGEFAGNIALANVGSFPVPDECFG